MTLLVCTAANTPAGCDATPNTPLSFKPGNYAGFAGPDPTYPYIEVSTGSTQIPSGATLTTPSITVNLTASGGVGTTLDWSQFEFKTEANIALLPGVNISIPVVGWPSAGAYDTTTSPPCDGLTPSAGSCPAQTTSPLTASLQYGPPPVLTSTTISGSATAPGAPTIGTATAGNGQATVTWTAPSNDGGSPITGYTVTSSPGAITATASGSATSATVTGLTNGTSYTFTVTATNAVGTGPASAASNAVTPAPPTAPGAPTIGTATAGDGQATVTWTAPSSDGGSPITGYTVTSSPGSITASASGSATSATVTGLTNGTSYTFTVTATNAVGTGPASAASNAVTPAPPTAPGAPTIGTATAGDGQATVTWTAPSSDGGSPITGYTVTSSPGSITASASGSATSATVTGLTNGTSYTFTVTATNAVGTGPASAASNAVTPGPNNPVTLNFAINAVNTWSIQQIVANWGASAVGSSAHIVRPHDATVSVPFGGNFNFVSAPSSQQIPTADGTIPINYITGTEQIYPLPAGTSYVSAVAAGPGTYSGGPASNPSGSFPLQVTYCTAPSAACTATTTPTPTFLGSTPGPYIEIGLGSAQVPAGATLNLPEVTVTLTGTSAETVNWTQSEFQTTANINLAGTPISVPVKGYPTAATSVPSSGPAPALLNPPPTLASVTVMPAAQIAVPGAPTENSVTAGDANVTIVWTPPTSNGGSPITGYVITPSSGSPVTVGAVTTDTVTGLTNGTPYTFTVAAINAAGTGPPSNTLPAVTPVAVTVAATTAAPAAAAAAAAVAPAATGSQLAFTGANIDTEVTVGVGFVLLGGLLLLARRLSGRRRRTT
ncbi:MAG: fibronectin type III domain-containing protein [Acidimicrobiales bacterium]